MTRSIFETQEKIDQYQILTNLLELKDLMIVGQEFDEEEEMHIFICAPKYEIAVCPCCGMVSTKIHEYKDQRRVRDIPLIGKATCLVFNPRRFECKICQKPFTQEIRDIVPDCSYTYRLAKEIADPKRKQAVSTLTEIYQLGYKKVEGIILKAAELKLDERRENPIQVTRLGIDEISTQKGQGKYVLVLTDLERRILVDILPDRTKQGLIDWLNEPTPGIDLSQLESAATDMWSHYRDAVLEVYPDVSVVADRFHVVQNLHEAIHEARRKAQRDAKTDEERTQLKGLRYLLLKNRENLSEEKDLPRLEQLQLDHPSLYELWSLRQDLHDWYETDTSPQLARPALFEWIERARQFPFPSLHTFCNTLTNWSEYILNFFTHRITSGFVEGMNSKIRFVNRISSGISSFHNFRLRMILSCG